MAYLMYVFPHGDCSIEERHSNYKATLQVGNQFLVLGALIFSSRCGNSNSVFLGQTNYRDKPGRDLWTAISCVFFATYTCVRSCFVGFLFPSIWPFSYKRAYICAQKKPVYRGYFMESAGVRYLRTSCWRIQKKRVRKYRTKLALSLWYCVYYIHTDTFIILAAFLF